VTDVTAQRSFLLRLAFATLVAAGGNRGEKLAQDVLNVDGPSRACRRC
jgi:hypothetical protein